jgi:predicted MFS family arabinose efflux permease
MKTPQDSPKTFGEQVIGYFKDFKVLKETRKEFWGLQTINALDCLAYFAMLNIIVEVLSKDFGFSDTHAGYVVTAFGSLTTILLVMSGPICDWLGVKGSTWITMLGLLATRIGALTAAYMIPGTTRSILVVASLVLMAPFMAMIQTVFQVGNKKFTTKRSQGAGYNLWYLFMNIGAAGGGFAIDLLYKTMELPRFHVFSLGIVTAVLCLLATALTIKRTEQLTSDESTNTETTPKNERLGPFRIFKAVVAESIFWKFFVFMLLIMGVRSVFVYISLLYPKFWLRMIGDDAGVGTLQALNPILVIIGLILFIPLLHRFKVFNMLMVGALITSLSMFLTAFPPVAGWDVAYFTYATTIGFLLVLTIGELIWSPRLYQFTAAISPKGQEGTYLGMSMIPYFSAKTVVGLFSGHMLERWCPEFPSGEPIMGARIQTGQIGYWDSPYVMFLILGMVALVGTIIVIIKRDWFIREMRD